MKYSNTEKLNQAERALIDNLCPNEKAKFDEWFDELKSKYLHLLGYIDIRYWYDVFMSGADTDEAATKVKTPCVMTFKGDYLFYFDDMKHLNLTSMEVRVSGIESCDSNVTNQFLSNTWGVVESKEHAEFIVELAKNCGIRLYSTQNEKKYFCCDGKYLWFTGFEHYALNKNRKQITIPLPPKADINEAGHNLVFASSECKEWPCVGDNVALRYKFDSKQVMHTGKLLYLSDSNIIIEKTGNADYHCHRCDWVIEKPKTPEEALRDDLINRISSYLAVIPGLLDNPDEAMYASHQAACELLTKYNITPKD